MGEFMMADGGQYPNISDELMAAVAPIIDYDLPKTTLQERIAARKAVMDKPEWKIRNFIGFHFSGIKEIDKAPINCQKAFTATAEKVSENEMRAVIDFTRQNRDYKATAYSIKKMPCSNTVLFTLYMQPRKPAVT